MPLRWRLRVPPKLLIVVDLAVVWNRGLWLCFSFVSPASKTESHTICDVRKYRIQYLQNIHCMCVTVMQSIVIYVCVVFAQPIQDPDPFINCDLMDGRDAFLTMARERHYEFSSLRRAKSSSMSMLYELHNQGQDRFVYTCNNCKGHVETRYHCTVCDVSILV
jgi:hypothetical protein